MTLAFAPERIEQWPLALREHLAIGLAFVGVSLARGFLRRRVFEAIRAR